jgi:hypothetical protein
MKTVKPNRPQAKKGSKKAAKEKPQAVPNIKELLLSGPKFDLVLPKRIRWRRPRPVIFE